MNLLFTRTHFLERILNLTLDIAIKDILELTKTNVHPLKIMVKMEKIIFDLIDPKG